MKKHILFFLLNAILCINLQAQSMRFAVHISNPLSMGYKAGGKLEFTRKQNSLLMVGTQYFRNLFNKAGTQVGLEWRTYSKPAEAREDKYFYYAKAIYGLAEITPRSGNSFLGSEGSPGFNYYGLGIGIGKKFYAGRWFLDTSAGLKYTYPDRPQSSWFYALGPGSIIDVRIYGGFEF